MNLEKSLKPSTVFSSVHIRTKICIRKCYYEISLEEVIYLTHNTYSPHDGEEEDVDYDKQQKCPGLRVLTKYEGRTNGSADNRHLTSEG